MTQQQVALSGHLIEDLTFASFRPGTYRAELVATRRPPLYKRDGFFVFTNVRPGQYRLRLIADRCADQEHDVAIPHGPAVFDSPPPLDGLHAFERPGDNELIAVVDTINLLTSRVTFAPELLPLGIPVGALVRAAGFVAHLTEALEPGLVSSVRLDGTAGLLPGAVLRVIRGRSVRMRFNPYDALPAPATRVVGRVTHVEDPSLPLPGVEVRALQINGGPVSVVDVEGALVATAAPGGQMAVLGTEPDVVTRTNPQGDYTLYSARPLVWTSVTLRARRTGFIDAVVTAPLLPAGRTRVDIPLTPL
jgi:hypothetical protein